MAKDIQIYLNNFFEKYGFSDAKIGVALSGGRDSVALAHALKKGGYDVVAINVEHGIRGDRSVADSDFVKSFCKEQNIDVYFESVDAPAFAKQNGYTLEQAARILRYGVFQNALDNGICDVVALAHHQDDQAETVLMRIIRGTGVGGLCGMRAVRGSFIRPLLDCPREDINEYCTLNSLCYVEDETNACTDYTRNYLRSQLAEMKERFPAICNNFARLSQNAAEEEDFVESLVPDVCKKGNEVCVELDSVKSEFLAKRLIFKAIRALEVTQDIESRHYPLIFALNDAQNGKKIQLTHGISVHKDGKSLVFSKDETVANECPEEHFTEGVFDDFGAVAQRVSYEQYDAEKGNGALFIDFDKLPDGAVLRHRKEGDFICKFGGGTKSLGDFLTDRKIALRKRDSLAVVAFGNEVFAVFGVEISSKVAVDENSVTILKLTIK